MTVSASPTSSARRRASRCKAIDRSRLSRGVQAGRQDAQRLGLLGPGPDRPGDRDRLLAARDGLLGPVGSCTSA